VATHRPCASQDLQSTERRRQIVFAYLETAALALAVETMTMLVESDADIEAAMTRPQTRWPSEGWAKRAGTAGTPRWQFTKMVHWFAVCLEETIQNGENPWFAHF
jgi:hypothetical protein